jgi:rod shape-determining protein MreC
MDTQLEMERLREAERENVRLREMLGYDPPPGFRTVPARVIGLDLDPLRGVAWVNIGYNRGLLGGEPVTTVRGLVGVVDQVENLQSRVRLLRNEDTPVSVRVARSRVLGIVEWDPGASRLKITKVPLHADMVPGDTLLTSGLGGVFPPGLLVGVVSDIEEPPDRLLKEATLRPFGTFFRLEEVFILMPGPGPSWPSVPFGVSATPAVETSFDALADSGAAPGDSAAADSAARREAPPSLPPPPDDELGPWIPPQPAARDSL